MGEPIRWSISVDEETEQIGDSLQAEFAPIVGDNRSRLVQMIFKSWHRLGFTMETLASALSQAQRIKLANAAQEITTLNNSSQVPAFPVDGRPKPLTRIVAPPSKGVRGRAISHVNRMDVANPAYKPLPFPGVTVCPNSTYEFSRSAA